MLQKLESIGGNRIVIALSSARLGDAIGNSILFVLVPLYVAALPSPAFPWPETVRVGVLISVFGLVNAFLEPVFGALIDRAGRTKPFIMVGLVLMAIATLGFLFATRYTDLLFLRTLQGIGVGVTVPAALALMVSASHKSTRGGSMGIYTTSRMLGLGIGPLIGGLLYDSYGFAPAFTVGGAFIILALVLVNAWVQDPPERKPVPKTVKVKIIDRKLLGAGIIGAAFATLIMAVDFSMISSLETQFNAKLGMSAFLFGLAFSAVVFSRVLVQVPLGRFSDHLGRKPFIIGGMLLLVPSTALLGYATTTTYLMVLRLIQGIASAAVAAPAFAVAGDLAQAGGEGRQMSILTMGFGLGVAIGPLLSGFLAVYSFTLPFVLAGLLSLIAAWATYRFVPETVTRQEVTREAPAFGGK
ncbi:MAG: MFS transporter [Anaerolineales bacterium]